MPSHWSHVPPHQPIDIHMYPNSIYICVYMHLHINQTQCKRMITRFIYWGPENANHFICIYMYKCINNSWYLQSGVLHIFFTKCHQSLRQWPLSTIRPWATGWARDGQGHLAIEYQIPLTWNGLEVLSSNSIAEERHEYWQYLKKYDTDISINKIWQKEQVTQLGLWAPSLVQLMINHNYNMTVWILAGNYISFTIAAGLIRLHMPSVKKSRV